MCRPSDFSTIPSFTPASLSTAKPADHRTRWEDGSRSARKRTGALRAFPTTRKPFGAGSRTAARFDQSAGGFSWDRRRLPYVGPVESPLPPTSASSPRDVEGVHQALFHWATTTRLGEFVSARFAVKEQAGFDVAAAAGPPYAAPKRPCASKEAVRKGGQDPWISRQGRNGLMTRIEGSLSPFPDSL